MNATNAAKPAPLYGIPSLASCLLIGYLAGSVAGFILGFIAQQLMSSEQPDKAPSLVISVMSIGLVGGIVGLVLGVVHRVLTTKLRHTSPILMGFLMFTLAGLVVALLERDFSITSALLIIAPCSFAGTLFGIGAGRAAEVDTALAMEAAAAKAANPADDGSDGEAS